MLKSIDEFSKDPKTVASEAREREAGLHAPRGKRSIAGALKGAAFWTVMLTWGLPQTLCGLVLMLTRYRRCPKALYHGAIVVAHDGNFGGVSLGGVTFVSQDYFGRRFRSVCAHEYGHCLQSLMLGPLYLPVIALPSSLWCNLPRLRKKRSNTATSYYSFFTERWANALTQRVTHDKPPEK